MKHFLFFYFVRMHYLDYKIAFLFFVFLIKTLQIYANADQNMEKTQLETTIESKDKHIDYNSDYNQYPNVKASDDVEEDDTDDNENEGEDIDVDTNSVNNMDSYNTLNNMMMAKINVDKILNKEKVVGSFDLFRLRNSLLHFYDKKARPLLNSSHAVQVYIGVSVVQINKLDEVFQVFS